MKSDDPDLHIIKYMPIYNDDVDEVTRRNGPEPGGIYKYVFRASLLRVNVS